MERVCHHCGAATSAAVERVGRRDACLHCRTDLHCCVNCTFYDPAYHNQCREPQAERQVDKQVGNFCDYFSFRAGRPAGPAGGAGDRARPARRALQEEMTRQTSLLVSRISYLAGTAACEIRHTSTRSAPTSHSCRSPRACHSDARPAHASPSASSISTTSTSISKRRSRSALASRCRSCADEQRLTQGQLIDESTRKPTVHYRLLENKDDAAHPTFVFEGTIDVEDAGQFKRKWLITTRRDGDGWKVSNFEEFD